MAGVLTDAEWVLLIESADHARDSVEVDRRQARNKNFMATIDYAPASRFFKCAGRDTRC